MAKRTQYNSQYHKEHRKEILARQAKRRYAMREDIREKQRLLIQKTRAKVFELLGGACCVRCGFDDKRALQIDHINGGGSKDHKRLGYGLNFYRKILSGERSISDLQILCANCNWIKRSENREERRAV